MSNVPPKVSPIKILVYAPVKLLLLMQPLARLEDNPQSYTGAKPIAVVCSEVKWLSSAALTLKRWRRREMLTRTKIEDFPLGELHKSRVSWTFHI